jgi:hypothetical protein
MLQQKPRHRHLGQQHVQVTAAAARLLLLLVLMWRMMLLPALR